MSSYFLDDLREELRAAATRRAARQHGPRIPGAGRRAVTAAALTLATVAAFLGVRTIARPGADDKPVTSAVPSAVESVDPDVARVFASLRRPVTAADAIPERWQNMLRGLAGGDDASATPISPNFAAARRASPDMSLWLVPGSAGVCLFETLGDGTAFDCGTAEEAARGHVFGISSGAGFELAAGERQVSGLLPDGVSDVSLRMRDGTTRPVTVHGNAYTIRVSGVPTELTWTDIAGAARVMSFSSENR